MLFKCTQQYFCISYNIRWVYKRHITTNAPHLPSPLEISVVFNSKHQILLRNHLFHDASSTFPGVPSVYGSIFSDSPMITGLTPASQRLICVPYITLHHFHIHCILPDNSSFCLLEIINRCSSIYSMHISYLSMSTTIWHHFLCLTYR